MTVTTGTSTKTVGATVTSLACNLATTNVGDFNMLTVSVNSTGTGIQPVIATPAGWAQIGDSWKTGSPSHEMATYYRFYQSGDPTSVTVTWTATGNATILPVSCSAGMIDTTTPIVGTEKAFAQSAGPTTVATSALTLAGSRYVFSVFGNRSGATWSAAADASIHDTILIQDTSSGSANAAMCWSGNTPTSAGGARSLLSSASTSVQNFGIFALNPATAPTATIRSSASNSGNSPSATATIPAGAVAGDTVLLAFTQGNTDVQTSAPTNSIPGPTRSNAGGTYVTKIYTIPVDGTTIAAGTVLTCGMSATRQWSMNMLVLTKLAAASAIAFHNENNNDVSNVVMPSLTTTASSFLVELASSKSNGVSITDWTAVAGWTKQSIQAATTTFGPATLWATPTTEPKASGTYGGETWTPNQTGGTALGFVIGLVSRPVASFTQSISTLTVSVNGTASFAVSPATVSSYDWNWGDGTAHGSGSTASHTYAAAGTYTVTLTVTDSNGGTNTATSSVNVASTPTNGFYVWNGTQWKRCVPYVRLASGWVAADVAS